MGQLGGRSRWSRPQQRRPRFCNTGRAAVCITAAPAQAPEGAPELEVGCSDGNPKTPGEAPRFLLSHGLCPLGALATSAAQTPRASTGPTQSGRVRRSDCGLDSYRLDLLLAPSSTGRGPGDAARSPGQCSHMWPPPGVGRAMERGHSHCGRGPCQPLLPREEECSPAPRVLGAPAALTSRSPGKAAGVGQTAQPGSVSGMPVVPMAISKAVCTGSIFIKVFPPKNKCIFALNSIEKEG